jgi:hypothetical protein
MAAALLLILPISAWADDFDVSITTTGTFTATGTNAYKELTFTDGVFTGTTAGGSLTLDPLGLFTLARPQSGLLDAYATSFELDITFQIPVGVGNNPTPFHALVTGSVAVTGTNHDSVSISYGINNKPETFSNQDGSGSFQLSVDDFTITVPGSTPVSVNQTGMISQGNFTPVPEPSGIALLATAAGLVTFVTLRRRKARV